MIWLKDQNLRSAIPPSCRSLLAGGPWGPVKSAESNAENRAPPYGLSVQGMCDCIEIIVTVICCRDRKASEQSETVEQGMS